VLICICLFGAQSDFSVSKQKGFAFDDFDSAKLQTLVFSSSSGWLLGMVVSMFQVLGFSSSSTVSLGYCCSIPENHVILLMLPAGANQTTTAPGLSLSPAGSSLWSALRRPYLNCAAMRGYDDTGREGDCVKRWRCLYP